MLQELGGQQYLWFNISSYLSDILPLVTKLMCDSNYVILALDRAVVKEHKIPLCSIFLYKPLL